MTDLRQAAQQALEAWDDPAGMKDLCVAMDALRTALEQQAEPVAWRAWFDADNGARWLFTLWPNEEQLDAQWEPLYTTPPQQQAAHGIKEGT